MARVAVLGGGAWGTAFACALAARHAVTLWARDAQQVAAMQAARSNARYLPEVALPPALTLSADLAATIAPLGETDLLVVATPTAALRTTLWALRGQARRTPLIWLCKGFERDSGLLAHQVAAQELAPDASAPVAGEPNFGPLSGPSFAGELARGLPTALTVAGSAELCAKVTAIAHGGALRIYASDDAVGVEVGGAVKNVLAIATGIADALGQGHNARAALITRGLAETTRLGQALGARAETLMGLAGLGDLILTATSDQSRNRQVGLMLGGGVPLAQALARLGHVAEGVWSAPAIAARAAALGVEMPITAAVCAVLDGRLSAPAALQQLLARDPRRETAA